MSDMETFFETSEIAERVKLGATVVMHRETMTGSQLLETKESGVYDPGLLDTEACELEVGGETVAVGRIIRRKGRSCFQITEVVAERRGGK